MTNTNRVPAGVPSGGEFATGTYEENGELVQRFQVVSDPRKEKLTVVPEGLHMSEAESVGTGFITLRTWDNGGGRMAYTTCQSIFYMQVDEEKGTYSVAREDAWSMHDTPDVDDLDAKFSAAERTVVTTLIDGLDATGAKLHMGLRARAYADHWDDRSPKEFEALLEGSQA